MAFEKPILKLSYRGESSYSWIIHSDDDPKINDDIEELKTILEAGEIDVKSYSVHYTASEDDQAAIEFLFTTIPSLCRNVEYVSIACQPNTSSVSYSVMVDSWEKLVSLEIQETGGASQEDLNNLLSKNKNLKNFVLKIEEGSPIETDDFFNYLPAEVIKCICITTWNGNMSFDNFIAQSENFTNLKTLSINECQMFDKNMAIAIEKISSLENLILNPTQYSDDFDEDNDFIGNLTNLKQLQILRSPGFKDEILKNAAEDCKITLVE